MTDQEHSSSEKPADPKPVDLVLGRPQGLTDGELEAFADEFVKKLKSSIDPGANAQSRPPIE